MKSLLLLLAIAALPLATHAQAPAGPAPAPGASPTPAAPVITGSEAASGVPLPSETIPPAPALDKTLPLMPEQIPPSAQSETGRGKHGKGKNAGEAGAGSTPATGTFAVEHSIRDRVNLRIAETKARNNARIQADWAAAHETRTDPDRQAAFTKYYTDLTALIIQIDPTVAEQANARFETTIARLHYNRLGDLPPDNDPFATPAPEAQGPNPPANDTQSPF